MVGESCGDCVCAGFRRPLVKSLCPTLLDPFAFLSLELWPQHGCWRGIGRHGECNPPSS